MTVVDIIVLEYRMVKQLQQLKNTFINKYLYNIEWFASYT